MMETSFSSYSGPEFLLFYGLLLVAAVAASIYLPGRYRAEGNPGAAPADDEELAYLAGGERRLTEAVLAGLMARGAVRAGSGRKLWAAEPGSGRTAPEQAVLRQGTEFGLKNAHSAIAPHASAIENSLVAKGLLLDRDERNRLRWLAAAPVLVLLAVGAWRLFGGLAQGEPVGFLVMLMVAALVMLVIRLTMLGKHTLAGEDVLAARRQQEARLQSAPTGPEMSTGVALFGTAILVGTPFNDLHAMRQAAGSDGGGGYASDGDSGGDGGGDGGGGCGGGGCGGCGG